MNTATNELLAGLIHGPLLHPRETPFKRKRGQPHGYARRPGSGPVSETCGTCAHCCGTGNSRRTYYKCAVIMFRWTSGPGTDIRKKSPACDLWAKAP